MAKCTTMSWLIVAVVVSCASAAAQADQNVAIGAEGQMKPAARKKVREHHQAAANGIAKPGHEQLCKSLLKVMKERRCSTRGVSVFHEQNSKMVALSKWPVSGCSLPKPLGKAHRKGKNVCTVTFAASAKNAESIYARLPAGGLVIVPMQAPKDNSFMRSEIEAPYDPEDLIWQAMYQVNSKLYFPEIVGDKLKLGLPGLQFATFFAGHALLQKADWVQDLHYANGTFWKLAKFHGTDKIDSNHNYSLLYHRFLDEPQAAKDMGGMMLEIGLGCMLEPGNAAIAGASAKIWPRMFPKTAVHFIDIDRLCVAHWERHMQEAGAAKIHIGGQADPKILAEVINDVKFAGKGGFGSVIDDGSHVPADIEASFRALMPSIKPGGLYFVEDIMFAAWSGYLNYQGLHNPAMEITSKSDRSSATPIALAAVLAAGITGLAEMPPADKRNYVEVLQKESLVHPTPAPDHSFFGPLSDRVNAMKDYVMESNAFVTITEPFGGAKNWHNDQATQPVASFQHPAKWRNEILAAAGSLVDFIECTPGICVFRRV